MKRDWQVYDIILHHIYVEIIRPAWPTSQYYLYDLNPLIIGGEVRPVSLTVSSWHSTWRAPRHTGSHNLEILWNGDKIFVSAIQRRFAVLQAWWGSCQPGYISTTLKCVWAGRGQVRACSMWANQKIVTWQFSKSIRQIRSSVFIWEFYELNWRVMMDNMPIWNKISVTKLFEIKCLNCWQGW